MVDSINPNTPPSNLYGKDPTPQSPKDQITAAQAAVAAAEAQFAKDGDATAFQTSLQSALAMLPTTSVNYKFDQDVKNIQSLIGQIENDPSGKNVAMQENMLSAKFKQALTDIGTSIDAKSTVDARDPSPLTPAQQLIYAQQQLSSAEAVYNNGGDVGLFCEQLNLVGAMLPPPTDDVKFNQDLTNIISLIKTLPNLSPGVVLQAQEAKLDNAFAQALKDIGTQLDAKAAHKSGHKPKH